jgi:hypothetical protein
MANSATWSGPACTTRRSRAKPRKVPMGDLQCADDGSARLERRGIPINRATLRRGAAIVLSDMLSAIVMRSAHGETVLHLLPSRHT